MKILASRGLRWTLLAAFVLSTTGCGFILHPERRTERLSTVHDTKVIVFDCLWLLAGVIPGVVALTVDGLNNTWFYTEAELERRQRRTDASHVQLGDDLAIRVLGPAPADAQLTLRLLDESGRDLLAPVRESVREGERSQGLSLRIPRRVDTRKATLVLGIDGREELTWKLMLRDRAGATL